MDTINTKTASAGWPNAAQSNDAQALSRSRSPEADTVSWSSSSLHSSDLEKQDSATPPSKLSLFRPSTWSRKMRLFALAGAVVLTLGLVPAIAVPLALEHDDLAGGKAGGQPGGQSTNGQGTGEPLFTNPPNTSVLAANTPMRIMPLGASITYGFLSTDGNGYREDLLGLLQQGGNTDVSYVGSRNNGTMVENAVEGWPGWRIDQVLPKAQASVPKFLPNVVLINVGTNDCVQDFNMDNTTKTLAAQPALTADSSFGVGSRLRIMVEDVLTMSPNATVVLSTLILNKNATINARVDDANAQYRSVASALQAEGRRVVLADMSAAAGGPTEATMADSTHPNDVGYSLMANRWYVALQEAADKGMIVAPAATSA